MTVRHIPLVLALTALGASLCTHAEEGVPRAIDGAASTISSPARIADGIAEETAEHGAVGVVTGSLKGGAEAAGQAVTGAANVGVGVLEAITAPLRD